jgi:hypothetical protein
MNTLLSVPAPLIKEKKCMMAKVSGNVIARVSSKHAPLDPLNSSSSVMEY